MFIQIKSPMPLQYRKQCMAIAQAQPAYFNDISFRFLRKDLKNLDFVLSVDENNAVQAFLGWVRKNPLCAEILWLAVHPDAQGRGLGTALLNRLEALLKPDGTGILEVKTVDQSAGIKAYAKTRRFYEHYGFALLETIPDYPGWEHCPCALYVKAV